MHEADPPEEQLESYVIRAPRRVWVLLEKVGRIHRRKMRDEAAVGLEVYARAHAQQLESVA